MRQAVEVAEDTGVDCQEAQGEERAVARVEGREEAGDAMRDQAKCAGP